MSEYKIGVQAYKGGTKEKTYDFYKPNMPKTCPEDAGKTAIVSEDGAWTTGNSMADGPIEPDIVYFNVKLNEGSYSSTMTYEEIIAIIQNGKLPIAIYDSSEYFTLIDASSSRIRFIHASSSGMQRLYITSSNYVEIEQLSTSAKYIRFDNSGTDLTSATIQDAIKELNNKITTLTT